MFDSNLKNNSGSDDIDLLNVLDRFARYIFKYKWYYLFAIIAGIIIGLVLNSVQPRYYKSRMILHSSFITNAEQIQIIENWNSLLARNEKHELARILNCSDTIISKIVSIEAAEIQKVFVPNNPNGFSIDVVVWDVNALDKIQKGIVYGLNNSEYIKDRVAARKKDLEFLLTQARSEKATLDSTKRTFDNIINSREKIGSSVLLDVSGINKQIVDMNEKIVDYSEQLQFTSGVQVLQSFSKFKTPVSPGKKTFITFAVIFCITLTWAYTLVIYILNRFKKVSIAK